MTILLLLLCVLSFISGIWIAGTDTMIGAFLLLAAVILAVGAAIIYTLEQLFAKSQK